MSAWTDALRGRNATHFGRHALGRASEVGYDGPADGDFARYVDQLMADAEAQQLAQARARTPQGQAARATRNAPRPPGTRAPAQSGDTRRSQAQIAHPPAAGRPRLQSAAWKLAPAAMWIVVFVAIMFFGAAASWLIGLAFLGNILFKLVAKAQARSKS